MVTSDVVLITERGIDVLLEGQYVPARSLQEKMSALVARDPDIAEPYFGALSTSAALLVKMFDVDRSPSDNPIDIEAKTQALYRRRLLCADGFQQDLYGLNGTIIQLEDKLLSRTRLSSLNDVLVPKTAQLYLVLAPKPSDLAAGQPLTFFSVMRVHSDAPLQPVTIWRSDSLTAAAEFHAKDALYAVHGMPGIMQRNLSTMRSAFLRQYTGLKREMSTKKMEFYPWMSNDAYAN